MRHQPHIVNHFASRGLPIVGHKRSPANALALLFIIYLSPEQEERFHSLDSIIAATSGGSGIVHRVWVGVAE